MAKRRKKNRRKTTGPIQRPVQPQAKEPAAVEPPKPGLLDRMRGTKQVDQADASRTEAKAGKGDAAEAAAAQAEVARLEAELTSFRNRSGRLRKEEERVQADRQKLEADRAALEAANQQLEARKQAIEDGSHLDKAVRQRHDELDLERSRLSTELKDKLEAARTALDHELQQARDAWSAEQESRRDALAQETADAEAKRAALLANARAEAAEITKAAHEEADALNRQAREENHAVLEAAREELQQQAATAEADRKAQMDHLAADLASVREREDSLAADKARLEVDQTSLKRGQERLQFRRDHLENDLAEFEKLKEVHEELQRRYDSGQVARLEADLSHEQETSARQLEKLSALREELDRVQAELSKKEGPAVGTLREQVAGLEAERGRLLEELAARPPAAEVEALRSEAARLAAQDTELRGLRTRLADLEHAQAAFDQERARLERSHRADLERVQDEYALVEKKLSESEERRTELEAALRGHQDAAEQAEAWTVERERLRVRLAWQDAELVRLQADLDRYTKAQEQKTEAAYGLLAGLDERHKEPTPGALKTKLRTKVLTSRLVKGLADGGLYYSQRDIASFVAGLATTRLMLLKGMSGTGKTSMVMALGQLLGAEVAEIPVQAGWRERSDLLGYYNTFSRRFLATEFSAALYRAGRPEFADRPYFILLDEVNLARIEYYFADFLSLLQFSEDKQVLRLMDESPPEGVEVPGGLRDGGRLLPIPPNVWFFGTANEDESTFEITDKVHDRAVILQLDRRHDRIAGTPLAPLSAAAAAWQRPPAATNSIELLDDFERVFGEALREPFRIGFGHRFRDQVRRFLPAMEELGRNPGEALDHFVETRLLHKIRRLRDQTLAGSVEQLNEALNEAWPDGWTPPHRSRELLTSTAQRLRN